jgi:hypothetical protein
MELAKKLPSRTFLKLLRHEPYFVSPIPDEYCRIKKYRNCMQVQWHMPAIPATWEVKVRGSQFEASVAKKLATSCLKQMW